MFDLSALLRSGHPRRTWKKGLAVTAAGALAIAVPAMPVAQAAGADEPGGASASVLESGIGTMPIASAAWSEASSESNPGPNRSGLNATALGRATVKIAGVDVPLADFIDFGQAGALSSESAASSPFDSRAISGTLSSDGSIHLDRDGGGFAPVTVDLLSVLKKAGVSGLTDSLVNKADLRLGIGGAEVIARGGEFLDPDGVGGPGRYRVGQADLDLGSLEVKGAAATLYGAAGRMQTAFEEKANELIDEGAVAGRFPGGTTVDATVNADFQDKVMKAILAQPITTKNHLLTVDFSTGVMTVHLDQFLHGQETVDGPLLPAQEVRPGDPTGLNNQNPNTEIVDDEIYPMVAESVHDLMDEVYDIAAGVVVGSLDSATVDWTATTKPDADNSATTTWSTTLRGTTTKAPACTGTGPNGPALCEAQAGVVTATTWADPLAPAYDYWTADNADQLFRLAVDDIKTGLITVPVRNAVAPFLDVFAKVVSLQVNHQETRTCTMADGTKGIDRLRVSALSLAVLRNANGVVLNLGNAGSRVAACTPQVQASVISVGGNQPLAEEGYSEADPGTNPGPNQGGVDPSVLNTRTIRLGDAALPLDQFVDYGQLAAMLSESTATTPHDGRAITGAAGADGSLELDSLDGTTFDPATIDVLSVLRKAGADGMSDLAVDQLLLKLGIGGSELRAADGRFIDPDGVGGAGRYRIAQADLDLHSPAIEQASSQIYDGAGRIDDVVEQKVGSLLDLTRLTSALPGGTTVTARVRSEMQEKIFKAILARPITTKNHVLTVDFSTGKATVRLDQALHGEETIDGPLLAPQVNRYGDPTGINRQNPNTELIDDEIYPMIAETVHDLMEEVATIVIGAAQGALASVTVDLTAVLNPLPGQSATATWSVNLMGEPTAPTCTPEGVTGSLLCKTLMAAVVVANPVVKALVVPVRDFLLGDAGHQLFALAVDDIKTGLITIPVRRAVDPVLQVMDNAFSIQVNHQRRSQCADGSDGSLELSALSMAVLGPNGGPRISFGNSRIHLKC